jgi:hypothetical protein
MTTASALSIGVAFVLTCGRCGDDCERETYAEAIAGGWTEIEPDLEGVSWNFLGHCPECSSPRPAPGRLFA